MHHSEIKDGFYLKGREMANRDWETAAYAGLVSSLKEYGDRLDIDRNYKLNSKPREIDCVIIDKLQGQDTKHPALDNDIARFFKRRNIIELKNPYEELNIDVIWKVISYASQYKSFGKDALTDSAGVDAIPADSMTITFLRLSKPQALFKYLKDHGCDIRDGPPGIYYINGLAQIDMQVVVGSELVGEKFVPLRIQKKNAADEDILAFVETLAGDMTPADREMAEAILEISVSENRESYRRLTGEGGHMHTALRELLREDFEQLEREADERVVQARLETAWRVERETARRVERETALRVSEETARKMLQWNIPMDQIQMITGVGGVRLREMAASLGQ